MRGLLGVFFAIFCSSPAALAAKQYEILDLGTLGGNKSSACDINDLGQVVGYSYTPAGKFHGFRTAPNRAINPAADDLGTLGGSQSLAYGINNRGEVVGQSQLYSGGQHAFKTAPNANINSATDDLGTFGGQDSYAVAINADGQVAGSAMTSTGAYHAFLMSSGNKLNASQHDLGVLSGTYSEAHGLNSVGQVVGYSNNSGFRTGANAVINPATDNVGKLNSISYTRACAINEQGQVVGYSQVFQSGYYYHAYRTAANTAINPTTDDLGTLGGKESYGYDINGSGTVVGWSYTSGTTGQHAFVVKGSGTMQDLNSLIDPLLGWQLTAAYGINSLGQIVGEGMIGGQSHAFLVTPVPEPTSIALGSLLMLAAWRKRRH